MLTRRGINILKTNYRLLARQFNDDPFQSFRTKESDPNKHTFEKCGHFYSIKPETVQSLFKHGGIPMSFDYQTKTFTETCVMIRQPAVEIMNIMKTYDPSKPPYKFVIYGKLGSGKSLTLVHLIHYAHEMGYLLVHVPWVPEWVRRTYLHREKVGSTTREGLVDFPMEAANWLVHFKTQNFRILKKGNLFVTNEYVWSKREVTPVGSSLLELIDFGINRIKFANDVIFAVLAEIKEFSSKKLCKTFVAIDGFNSIYSPLSRQKFNCRKITPKEISLVQAFLSMTQSDWCNGVVVLVVDQMAVKGKFDSYFPRHLLEREGFDNLDPFIPIEVKNYTEKEYLSCMSYYRDRMWVRDHPEAETELAFLTAKNPYQLMKYCAAL